MRLGGIGGVGATAVVVAALALVSSDRKVGIVLLEYSGYMLSHVSYILSGITAI